MCVCACAWMDGGLTGRPFAAENDAPNKLQCSDVVLFWRLNHALQSSGTLLRLEATEYRKELERDVRAALDDIGAVRAPPFVEVLYFFITATSTMQDTQAKLELFASPQLTLAEEIEVVRLIHSKLEAFIRAIEAERKKLAQA